jgi:hypothetical protein
VTSRIGPKLSYRYFGPFQVEAQVGSVAYKLKLPPLHLQWLSCVSSQTSERYGTYSIHSFSYRGSIYAILAMVLDHRATTRNNYLYHQLLVQWWDSSLELVTWEDEDELLRLFSEFSAQGQVIANGGEMSRFRLWTA